MKAPGEMHVPCPVCDAPLTVPVTFTTGARIDDRTTELRIETDTAAARAHLAGHQPTQEATGEPQS